MFVCQWLESYLSEGTVRRPVWGPGNLTGGSEPKWGRAGSGRKMLPVNKDVKENLADSDAIYDRFQCLSEPKWGRAGSGRKVHLVNKDVKENLADSDAIPNPIFWINGSN